MSFLQSVYFNNRTSTVCAKEYQEAQKRVYTAIDLGRDSLFCAFKSKVIFVFNDAEYNAFLNIADDILSRKF